jgi:hypothetical protein
MQCPHCKRWYEYAIGPEYPDQGSGCTASISVDGTRVYGGYGSVVLDGENATVEVPGVYDAGTVICDFCYLQGVKRGVFKERDDYGRALVPEALRSDDICIIHYDPGHHVGLLFTFEERWVFCGRGSPGRFNGEPRFECLGFPERSDCCLDDTWEQRADRHAGILQLPGVVALCERMEPYLK